MRHIEECCKHRNVQPLSSAHEVRSTTSYVHIRDSNIYRIMAIKTQHTGIQPFFFQVTLHKNETEAIYNQVEIN